MKINDVINFEYMEHPDKEALLSVNNYIFI